MTEKEMKNLTYDMNSSEITSEQITKELNLQQEVMKEILSRQEVEKIRNVLTNPSAIALTTTRPDTGAGIEKVKKSIRDLFTLYLTNQFVARAVNVRADTLVSRGYRIVGEDEKGVEACESLVEASGGINLFRQLSINTDIAGDGFLEKIYNNRKTKIVKLRHVHPLTITFKRHKETNRILTGEDKEPVGYTQIVSDFKGKEVEKDIPKDRIEHLRFNTLGDEFTGLSTIQPGYDTIVRLMNMEYAAAEAAVKTANPLFVAKTNTKSPNQIALWGHLLGRINGKEQVFLPDGMELSLLSPGPQNFSDYSKYFLNAVVAAFGVPSSLLLGESSRGSRAESLVLSRHFYAIIRGNQRYVEEFFNNIFEEYAEMAGFEAPRLLINDIAEDIHMNSKTAIDLYSAGVINLTEARKMIGLSKSPEVGTQNDMTKNIEDDVKENDMEAWHNNPGQPSGSQAGEKKSMENDPTSTFQGEK